jgi:hypothetical protein
VGVRVGDAEKVAVMVLVNLTLVEVGDAVKDAVADADQVGVAEVLGVGDPEADEVAVGDAVPEAVVERVVEGVGEIVPL